MLKKAASTCILGQEVFNHSLQLWVRTAGFIEEGITLGWLEPERGLEQLRHQLRLTSHSSPPKNTPSGPDSKKQILRGH